MPHTFPVWGPGLMVMHSGVWGPGACRWTLWARALTDLWGENLTTEKLASGAWAVDTCIGGLQGEGGH